MMIKMCFVIKEKIFMKDSEDAGGQIESGRKRAITEVLEKAREVKSLENYRLIRCNQIKDRFIK